VTETPNIFSITINEIMNFEHFAATT
jgi:hypothetical protein